LNADWPRSECRLWSESGYGRRVQTSDFTFFAKSVAEASFRQKAVSLGAGLTFHFECEGGSYPPPLTKCQIAGLSSAPDSRADNGDDARDFYEEILRIGEAWFQQATIWNTHPPEAPSVGN